MLKVFIRPLDVLMFRNERPFTATETHVAKMGVISPRTFEGAIKSKLLAEICEKKNISLNELQSYPSTATKNAEKKDTNAPDGRQHLNDQSLRTILQLIGHPSMKTPPTETLRVTNVSFAIEYENGTIEEYFPLPNDIVAVDTGLEEPEYDLLTPSHLTTHVSNSSQKNHNLFTLLPSSTLQVKPASRLMPSSLFKKYLHGTITPSDLKQSLSQSETKKKTPYEIEERSGIQIELGKQTAEGALYVAEFMRLNQKWSFTAWLSLPDGASVKIPKGIIRLGGEGRAASMKPLEPINFDTEFDAPKIIEQINTLRCFKLILTAPSYFGGALPPTNLLESHLGVQLRLIGALPGKPIYVGGFDIARNKERALQRWVAPGATYFYCLTNDTQQLSLDQEIFISQIGNEVDIRSAFLAAPSKTVFRGETSCIKKVW